MNVWLRRAIGAAGIAVGYLLLQGHPAGASELVHVDSRTAVGVTASNHLAPSVGATAQATGGIATSAPTKAQLGDTHTSGHASVTAKATTEHPVVSLGGNGKGGSRLGTDPLSSHAAAETKHSERVEGSKELLRGCTCSPHDAVEHTVKKLRDPCTAICDVLEHGSRTVERGKEKAGDLRHAAEHTGSAGLLACLALCDWRRVLCCAEHFIRDTCSLRSIA
jgi:hypothetical protein